MNSDVCATLGPALLWGCLTTWNNFLVPRSIRSGFGGGFLLKSKNSVLGISIQILRTNRLHDWTSTSRPARVGAWKGQEGQSPQAPLAVCCLPRKPGLLLPWHQPERDTQDLHGHMHLVCAKSGEGPGASV